MPHDSPAASAREQRHETILGLVDSYSIHSQAELQRLLAEAGVRANQGTLSRDLRELGIVKAPDGYARPGAEPAPVDAITRMTREWLLECEVVDNLVVLKTPPSGAQPLARSLDRSPPPQIAGTIAGDDTILVITRGARDAKAFVADLERRKGETR